MAKVTLDENSKEVKDGESIQQACEELGIPFACQDGACMSCKIEILEGEDNLTDLSAAECNFDDLDKKNRLACQCSIKSGEVKIQPSYL